MRAFITLAFTVLISGCRSVEHPNEIPYFVLGAWCNVDTDRYPLADLIRVSPSVVVGYGQRNAAREVVRVTIDEIIVQRTIWRGKIAGVYLRGKDDSGKPQAIFFEFPQTRFSDAPLLAEVSWLFFDEGSARYLAVHERGCRAVRLAYTPPVRNLRPT